MKARKEKVIRVRVSVHESKKVTAFADKRGTSISHVIREYIRRLPNPNQNTEVESDLEEE